MDQKILASCISLAKQKQEEKKGKGIPRKTKVVKASRHPRGKGHTTEDKSSKASRHPNPRTKTTQNPKVRGLKLG